MAKGKKDAGNLNEVNLMSSGAMVADEAVPGSEAKNPSTGTPSLPPTLRDFTVGGGAWDGRDGGKAGGSPVELTERSGSDSGGMAAADAALAAIGARPKASHMQSGLLNVTRGEDGEKIDIPSESNLNSANQRVGA